MNIKNIQYLLHVAETENISQSSRELFIAQPALSRLIAETEKEVGYPLFDRIGKKIVLNQNGTIFMNCIRSMLLSWQNMQKELDEKNHNLDLHLSVGAEACSQLLPSILQLFHSQNPNADIQVVSAYPLDFIKGNFDFLLKAESVKKKKKFDPNDLLLLEEDILLAIPQRHPLNKREVIYYEDTLKYPYILPTPSSSLGNMLFQYLEEKKLTKPEHSTTVNNSYLLCEFVSKGLGISLIPSISWNYVRGNQSVVLKKLKDWDLKRIIYLVSNPSHYQTCLSKTFKQFLIQYFKSTVI